MSNILAQICTDKQAHIANCKAHINENELLVLAKQQPATRGFHRALKDKKDQKQVGLIAEIKKASPSKGLIREDFNPPALAQAYELGGATCLSVLTDTPYFQGDDAYLKAVKAACMLPVLRKDFMLDPYQIIESRALGADCILLIMAALDDAQATELEATAMMLGMDILIEVHDEPELERALKHLKSPLIGINNRNLKTMEIDLATSESLCKLVPTDHTLVCESGIYSHDDIVRMQTSNMHCFLVGESLMRQADVAQAVRDLLGA